MALPLERFFVLIDILNERRDEEAREELSRAAFMTWRLKQHQFEAMFQHAGMSVDKKNRGKFESLQNNFWSKFPSFNDYLTELGITKERDRGSPNANRKHSGKR